MPKDPSNPDAFEDAESPSGDSDLSLPDAGPETPEADAAEQFTDLLEEEEEDTPLTESMLDEVNPADAAEQARVVEINDEDYR